MGLAFALRNQPGALWISLLCLFISMIAGLGALSEMIWYFMRGYTLQLRAAKMTLPLPSLSEKSILATGALARTRKG